MPTTLGMAAANAGQNAVGAGMGLLLQGINDRRQLRQQERLQNLQIRGQQQMVDYNYAKELQMWKDTNYKAQMAELKAAGLNPALMYKQGGAGGITGQPVGSVQGGTAPAGGMEIMNMMMTKAQMELIKAQTEKTKAEAVNVPLTGENIKADTEVKRVTEENMNIANEIAGATQNAQKAMIFQALRTSYEEMEIAKTTNKWTDQMFSQNFKQSTASIAEAAARTRLANEQSKLSQEQQNKIIEDVKLMWEQLDISKGHLAVEQQLANWNTSLTSQAVDTVRSLIGIIPGMRSKTGGKTGGKK